MIRNIVFDIGGVLLDFHWDEFLRSNFDEKMSQRLTKLMWKNPDWAEFDKGNLSDEEVLQLFIQKAPSCEKEIRLVFAKIAGCFARKETSIPLIEALKGKGYHVFYLSNYFEYLMHTAPWVLDFVPHTEGGIFSCYEHLIKPDRRIYALLCERFGLVPEECIFIDDNLANVDAARAFGMQAIHYLGQTMEEIQNEIAVISA